MYIPYLYQFIFSFAVYLYFLHSQFTQGDGQKEKKNISIKSKLTVNDQLNRYSAAREPHLSIKCGRYDEY